MTNEEIKEEASVDPSSPQENDQEMGNPSVDRVGQLEEEISSLKDLYLRKQAEFENFRKRMMKEKEEVAIFANKHLMEEFIGLMDNFERALDTSRETKDFDQFFSGISMIHSSFLSSMSSKFGLETFGAEGDAFDPEQHEAIMMENDESVKTPTIKEVFQKGYSLQGRVIRTAKVKVVQA